MLALGSGGFCPLLSSAAATSSLISFLKPLQTVRNSIRPMLTLYYLLLIGVVLFGTAAYYAEFTLDGCRAPAWTAPTGEFCLPENGYRQVDHTSAFNFTNPANATQPPEVVTCLCLDQNPFKR